MTEDPNLEQDVNEAVAKMLNGFEPLAETFTAALADFLAKRPEKHVMDDEEREQITQKLIGGVRLFFSADRMASLLLAAYQQANSSRN